MIFKMKNYIIKSFLTIFLVVFFSYIILILNNLEYPWLYIAFSYFYSYFVWTIIISCFYLIFYLSMWYITKKFLKTYIIFVLTFFIVYFPVYLFIENNNIELFVLILLNIVLYLLIIKYVKNSYISLESLKKEKIIIHNK